MVFNPCIQRPRINPAHDPTACWDLTWPDAWRTLRSVYGTSTRCISLITKRVRYSYENCTVLYCAVLFLYCFFVRFRFMQCNKVLYETTSTRSATVRVPYCCRYEYGNNESYISEKRNWIRDRNNETRNYTPRFRMRCYLFPYTYRYFRLKSVVFLSLHSFWFRYCTQLYYY